MDSLVTVQTDHQERYKNTSRRANYNNNMNNKRLNEIFEIVPTLEKTETLDRTIDDVQKLCRICLLSKDVIISADISNELYEKYVSITAIEIPNESVVPLQVCELCKNDLFFCHNFKVKCQKSETTFQKLIDELITHGNMDSSRTKTGTELKIENYLEEIPKNEMADEHKDIQYLEDSNEFDYIENLHLNLMKEEDSSRIEDDSIIMPDAEDFLKRVVSRRRHKNVGERKKCHPCAYCSKKFLKVKTLKAHVMSLHSSENRPYSCDQCTKTFGSEHDLHLHSALHMAGDIWTCNKCDKKFQEKSRLRRHIQRHMESKRHSCPTCSKSFTEMYALRRHERVHTGEVPDKRHACHLCDKRYSSRALLAAHVGRHSDFRPCVCQSCGKSFPSQRLLTSHRLIHSDNKPHACNYCEKTFRHESTRNTHHRTHTGEKPFVCASCGKTFIQRSNLILHMRTHTGERPYSCNMCERSFTSGSSLKNHIRTHTGDKPYSCPVCQKRFARVDMRAHMAQHTGERPHACTVCTKRFTSAWRLREHCRLHTGEKPFECANCTDKFATKSQLIKHFKTHQKERKLTKKREVLIVRKIESTKEPHTIADNVVILQKSEESAIKTSENTKGEQWRGADLENNPQEMPLEVTQEVILKDECDEKPDVLVLNVQNSGEFQNGEEFHNGVSFSDDVKYVTLNDGGVSISSTSMLESATTVKLYQVDQSLLQIHTSGRQLTISKVTSKMTANF